MFAARWSSWLLVAVLGAVLSGCATEKVAMSQSEFLDAMGKSSLKIDSLLDKGNQEEAVRILGDLAKRNPDRKEPWVRMAKVHFDAENYSQAIVSAEEALQRDNADREAKSIRAVAGLRVASQSLTELRNDVELKGNARSDAAGLAKVMRETLGEDVLVPPAELEARKKKEAAAAKREAAMAARARARTEAKRNEEAAPASAPSSASTGGNPFSVLR
ncbi:MAG: tetratricopeptide repeat protein [Dechloromonas sp.]|nr:tetratricopeptide repeat protein [Dechloromonas sp.]